MQLGIFESILARPTLDSTLDAVVDAGLRAIQFDFATVGLASLPATIPGSVASIVREAATKRSLAIAGLHGTYNMIHPDPAMRATGMAGLRALAAAAPALGTTVIALSTGTRDAENMWRRHPENDSADAWADLTTEMTKALALADEFDITLAIEPEPANVVRSPAKARELLDQFAHPRLRICFDAANIAASDLDRAPEAVIGEAFALLGGDIAIAHGKDITATGAFCPAGTGIVPWPWCVRQFGEVGYDGALILHSLREADIPRAIAAMTA